jgi:hypothetical protein
MSYNCECDYDEPSFYRKKVRRARKAHKCYECSGMILPSDTYEYAVGKWDAISVFVTCQHCVNIRTWTRNNMPCLCWSHGNTIDDCREAVDEAVFRAPEETRGLKFGLLRRIAARDRFYRTRNDGRRDLENS